MTGVKKYFKYGKHGGVECAIHQRKAKEVKERNELFTACFLGTCRAWRLDQGDCTKNEFPSLI